MTNIKLTSDQFAVVDINNKWLDAKKFSPPRGAKMMMIDRKLGVAVLGVCGATQTAGHTGAPCRHLTGRKNDKALRFP